VIVIELQTEGISKSRAILSTWQTVFRRDALETALNPFYHIEFIPVFFLERAGELHIIVLIEEEKSHT
jgi:hypothetical protein